MNCGIDEVLAITGLAVQGPQGPILRDICFTLHRGEAVCLVGETGAGKSMVAQALFGLLPPGLLASGTMALGDGRRFDLSAPASLRPLWGRDLFLLPQEPGEALDPTARLLPQVAEAVKPQAALSRPRAALNRLLSFGLDTGAARKIPAALSGGMAQRALLAVAAEVDAPLLVADEPTKGLDAGRRDAVAEALRQGCVAGRALLVVTHDLRLPLLLGARVLLLHDAQLVEAGPAEAVLTEPRHPWARALMAAQPERWPRPSFKPSREPVLAARDLAFGWGSAPDLFAGVQLALRPGEMLGVAGPSGAGKSTLCDVLLGLHAPRGGAVCWQGDDVARLPATGRRRRRLGYQKLYQDPAASFPPHRRLRGVFADLGAVTDDLASRLPALMERLRLPPRLLERRVGEVSGGEAQRLALARALLLRPLALLADEPTSRLDAVTQAEIALLLRELAEQDGLAILVVSHDEALLAAVASDIVRL